MVHRPIFIGIRWNEILGDSYDLTRGIGLAPKIEIIKNFFARTKFRTEARNSDQGLMPFINPPRLVR